MDRAVCRLPARLCPRSVPGTECCYCTFRQELRKRPRWEPGLGRSGDRSRELFGRSWAGPGTGAIGLFVCLSVCLFAALQRGRSGEESDRRCGSFPLPSPGCSPSPRAAKPKLAARGRAASQPAPRRRSAEPLAKNRYKEKEFRQICLLTFKDFLPIPVCPLLH